LRHVIYSTTLGASIYFLFFALPQFIERIRFPSFQRFLNPPPLLLVKNGHIIERHLKRELITEQELMSQLRQQGVESLKDVKRAFMEADGGISVIRQESQTNSISTSFSHSPHRQ
jgi:uncharacterized membrane protein YcaP (DUF421 family)